MAVLTWFPQVVEPIRIYPARSTSPGAVRFFRKLLASKSRPSRKAWRAADAYTTGAERDELLALFESTGYGGGEFLWTPPNEQQHRCRFAQDSLSITRSTALDRYVIEVQIEQV